MNCKYIWFLYNRRQNCIVDEVQINALEMCKGCMFVSLDNDFLENTKEKELGQIEARWEAFLQRSNTQTD